MHSKSTEFSKQRVSEQSSKYILHKFKCTQGKLVESPQYPSSSTKVKTYEYKAECIYCQNRYAISVCID